MKKIFTFLTTLLFLTNISFAQMTHEQCGTDQIVKKMLEENPEMAKQIQDSEERIAHYIANNPNKMGLTYTVPVVVHVIHENGPENIPDSQIMDMMAELNRDFQKLNPDTSAIAAAFQSIIGDMDMEFRLASKDPNGNCTNGITRTVDPVYTNHGGCPGGNCGAAKPIAWPKEKYLNIWVVKDIASGAGAYAYLASQNVPTGLDGVVCRYQQFGVGNSRTITHEVGHYMNLWHVWADLSGGVGSGQPGNPSNCNLDDGVADTPNTIGNSSGCNLTRVTCGSLDNVQNYMDYASCPAMFTQGQVARMQAAIANNLSQRATMMSASNLIATGTDDATFANPPTCAPIAQFGASTTLTCSGGSVSFVDRSYNATFNSNWTYSWSFPGGTPATSTDRNPVILYNTPGNYSVTMTATNSGGSSQPLTKSNFIEIIPGSGSFIAPYKDEISNSNWPNNADPTLKYTVKAPSGSIFGFSRTTNAFYSAPSSIFLNNFSYNNTGEHEFITPVMDLTNMVSGSTFLNFQIAYSRKANENELIGLYSSTNCGQTWNLDRFIFSTAMVSVPNSNTSAFVPADTSEWKFLSYDVSGYAGAPNVQFAFRFNAKQGNNLYIDDLEISEFSTPQVSSIDNGIESTINLYPNPNNGVFNLDFYLNSKSSVKAEIVDLVGKRIAIDLNSKVKNGWNNIQINANEYGLTNGMYLIKLESDNKSIIERFIIE